MNYFKEKYAWLSNFDVYNAKEAVIFALNFTMVCILYKIVRIHRDSIRDKYKWWGHLLFLLIYGSIGVFGWSLFIVMDKEVNSYSAPLVALATVVIAWYNSLGEYEKK
jgi:nucleoside recognition membrane protein YjiH